MNSRLKMSSGSASVLLLLLLLCVASVLAARETCPPQEDIAPCWCIRGGFKDKIDIYCDAKVQSVTDLKSIFAKLQGKKIWTLWLDSVPMKRVPTDLFKGMRVGELSFYDCDLEGLADTDDDLPFQGLERSLEVLKIDKSFKGNQLKHLNLSHMERLTEIDCEYNNIPEVKNEWFRNGLSRLWYISFSSCQVKSVGDRAFAYLSNLSYLDLNDNDISELKRSMFPSPDQKLKYIYLDANKVSTLPEDIFTDMHALIDVEMDNCGIRQLPEATWARVWDQLVSLHLSVNPLECDSHMNWMFGKKRPRFLIGRCETPAERNGHNLAKVIDEHENNR